MSELSRRLNSYIDQVIEGLIGIYETERRRWDSRTGAARAAQIRLVLESDSLPEESARQLLGVPVAGWHRAAIAWLSADVPGQPGALPGRSPPATGGLRPGDAADDARR